MNFEFKRISISMLPEKGRGGSPPAGCRILGGLQQTRPFILAHLDDLPAHPLQLGGAIVAEHVSRVPGDRAVQTVAGKIPALDQLAQHALPLALDEPELFAAQLDDLYDIPLDFLL